MTTCDPPSKRTRVHEDADSDSETEQQHDEELNAERKRKLLQILEEGMSDVLVPSFDQLKMFLQSRDGGLSSLDESDYEHITATIKEGVANITGFSEFSPTQVADILCL